MAIRLRVNSNTDYLSREPGRPGAMSNWGGGLCRGAVVEIEQATETRRLDNLPVARVGPPVGEGDDVVQPLMVSFVMMVGEVLGEDVAQRMLTEESQLVEALVPYRTHPAFSEGIEIG